MAGAALPFLVYFGADGSSSSFTLDTVQDIFYFYNHIALNTNDAYPTIENLSRIFDIKKYPTGVVQVAAKNAINNNDLGYSSFSIDGPKITFTLSSAPATGTLVAIYGFVQF